MTRHARNCSTPLNGNIEKRWTGSIRTYRTRKATEPFPFSPEAMGRRALRNVVLAILSSTHGTGCTSRSKAHYDSAANMTDRVAALSVLADIGRPEREEAFADFYDRFKTYPLVVDKWFALQASCNCRTTSSKI
ncbi:MAG: aminopeptidase N C-terminal domain-containing protein [Alphaproteobacteria bacterium]